MGIGRVLLFLILSPLIELVLLKFFLKDLNSDKQKGKQAVSENIIIT